MIRLLPSMSLVILFGATLAPSPSAVAQRQRDLTPAAVQADFEALWQHVADNYAYFDSRLTDWPSVPRLYKPDLARVKTRDQLIGVLESVLDELYDAHAHLNANTAASPRLVPSGADIWAEWRDGRATVEEVRDDSDAQRAGLRPGAEILALDGVPIVEALRSRTGRSLHRIDDAVRSWALRAVLAGRHHRARRIQFRAAGIDATVSLPAADQFGSRSARVTARTLPDSIGYIRLHDSLGDSAVIAEFDAALAQVRTTAGLILDLRDTPGGGNSTIARAILGRFVAAEQPYQKHLLPSEEKETGIRRSWLELVGPRGPFRYENPVVVLVGHWTGSMGEGLAVGFDATNAATIVGTPMGQLLGATYQFRLPHSGIGMNVPAEKLFHVNGTPREAFVPPIRVTLEELAQSTGDAWMTKAVQSLVLGR